MNNDMNGANRKVYVRTLLLACGVAVLAACAGQLDPDTITRGADDGEAYQASRAELVRNGQRLWTDPTIGNSGLSCNSCHVNNAQFRSTFAEPYPHQVRMASGRAGLEQVTTEEMVQLCMVVPMKAEPLAWDSRELAALSAYVDDVVQPAYAEQHGK